MPEELFDVVDEQDLVIGQLPRSQVHAERKLHRAVHIFVFNSAGHLLIHKRAADKDEQPNKWTSSASGHLSAGEDYDETAHREMKEEVGLSGELEFLHKFPASSETSYEHTALYRMTSDEEPTFDPAEIAEGRYCPLDVIESQLNADPTRFAPAFHVLFRWYLNHSC
jgi:16S rRNA (adenine1518-N6/adenine1519-N6)-dimethyltransferase